MTRGKRLIGFLRYLSRQTAEAALLGVVGGAAARARRKLVDSGDLIEAGTGVKITDPLMADWIRGRFSL